MEESGSTVAWRLLATLEGGTLLLVVFGLLLHATRRWLQSLYQLSHQHKRHGTLRVIITNQHASLRERMSELLKAEGCTIVTSETSETSETTSSVDDKVDALIVIGSHTKRKGLYGLSDLVADDVYQNLKLLDSLMRRVTRGGRVLWVSCEGDATSGAFSAAIDAFDELVKSQLQQAAKASMCEAVWVGRHKTLEQAAQSVVSLLMPRRNTPSTTKLTIRSLSARLRHIICR